VYDDERYITVYVFGDINVKCINNIPTEEQAPLSADK
jgi:hypothetical protein